MDITIIGPGKMGRAIGTRAVAGGHSVTFVGKTLESAQAAAEEVPAMQRRVLGPQRNQAPRELQQLDLCIR